MHWILLLFFIGLTMWAQYRVQSKFKKWSKVSCRSNLTGVEVARRILDENGLSNVSIEPVPGSLSDHYDPTSRVVRLSEPVYSSNSISAISVAAHECGHAIQHKERYGALTLRHQMVPLVNITSGIAPWLILGGFIFHAMGLALIGIVFFSFAVLFHLVTLPVEFNASSRAKEILYQKGMVHSGEEERGVSQVLNAAAFTYVASALVALLQLIQFILAFLQSDD